MSFAKSATLALAVAALGLPILSQPSAGQDAIGGIISPDAWLVYPNASLSAVRISKTATDGVTVFSGGCDKYAGPVFAGSLSGYPGSDLQRIDGLTERVLFEVTGEDWKEAFAVKLRFSARTRSWGMVDPLAPVFVNSFSRGSKLTVRNGQWREVVSFDLTGSSNAARTIRSICGN